MNPRFAFPSWAFLLLLTAGCVTPYVPLPTLGTEVTTTTLDEDERYLWKKSRALQHEVETSGLVFEDPELDAYLRRVLDRVSADELAVAGVDPRVQVISDVRIHGYSFANGVIYVHTALLARMQDETQLATVLSRELAHVIHRHALRARREETMRANTMAWVGVGSSVSEYGSGAQLIAQAFALSSATGFPHALETQADAKGLATLNASGYDVRQTPEFFQMTVDYLSEVHAQGPLAWAPFTPPPADDHADSRISPDHRPRLPPGGGFGIATTPDRRSRPVPIESPPRDASPGGARVVGRPLPLGGEDRPPGNRVVATGSPRVGTPRTRARGTAQQADQGQTHAVDSEGARRLQCGARDRRTPRTGHAGTRHDLLPHDVQVSARRVDPGGVEVLPSLSAHRAQSGRRRVRSRVRAGTRGGGREIQSMTHRRALACAALVLLTLAPGCAPIWSRIEKQSEPFPMATIEAAAYLPVGWGSANYETLAGVWHFTRHGIELQEIYLRRWPKTSVVKGTNRSIRDTMTVQEIALLSIDSRKLDEGVGALEVISNKPTTIDGRDCYRLDYRYRNGIGLPKRTVEYGCPVGRWMYRFEYNAPAQHYFEANLADFEAMAASIEFRVPGA